MISIRRFLDTPDASTGENDLLTASLRLRDLLLDGTSSPAGVPAAGPEPDAGQELLQRLENATAPSELLAIAGEAVEAARNHTRTAMGWCEEYRRQMHAMVAMLTEALAEVSGQADSSVAQLQEIEKQIENASSPADFQALKESLANCIASVKLAIAGQRKATLAALQHLQEQVQRAQTATPPETASAANGSGRPEAEYVAAFRLLRAEHIVARFGEGAQDQMLSVIGETLKANLRANDRLMRWKGPSYVMFLNSSDHLIFVRRRLAAAVARIGQRYVELGKNSALLAVGVDWTIFQQSRYASLDLVLAEVDAFLENGSKA